MLPDLDFPKPLPPPLHELPNQRLHPHFLHWEVPASLAGSFPVGKDLSIAECLPLPLIGSSWSSGLPRDMKDSEEAGVLGSVGWLVGMSTP